MAITKKAKFLLKIVFSICLLLSIITAFVGVHYYNIIYQPSVVFTENTPAYFYIPTNSSFNDVSNSLYSQGFIKNKSSFEWVAEKKKYPVMIKPGKYELKNRMNNNDLVDLLRSGKQVPVQLTFNNIRLKPELAGQIAQQIEADSVAVLTLLNSAEMQAKYGFNSETFFTMFIPNTYEFNWNTSATQFVQRMAKEYKRFWNASRIGKAKKINLSQSEVAVLASILQKETSKNDEKPMVAEVYLNRLEKGMPLQADPTLIFALNDFSIHRVLNKHKLIDSPYNTYMYKGLPPGPICLPEISSLEAVLNHKKHDYIYFCAKADFSGYHSFAKTYAEHRRNAKKWYKAMNAKKIYK